MEKKSEGPSCLYLRLSAGGARLSIASCASVASLFKQRGNGPLGQTWKKITKNKITVNHNWTRVCSQSALVTAGSFQSTTPALPCLPPASLQPVSPQPASLCPAPDRASNLRPGSTSNESITRWADQKKRKKKKCSPKVQLLQSGSSPQRRNVAAENRKLWIENPRRIPAPSISETSKTSRSIMTLSHLD